MSASQTERVLIKGNEAVAFGAVDAGCRCYFGYPITPQNEIPEALSVLLPENGGRFVQAESEVAASNMLLGAAACGVPAMTSSSGCGISLMQEAVSYMAGSHVPGVIVNMQRGGPGLGDIGPSQGDYFQAVKGGGHGDHRNLVLAPATAQECYDFMFRAFALAFKYANPVMVLGDAIVGQIKEPVRREPPRDAMRPEDIRALAKDWRLEGYGRRGPGAAPRLLKSVYLAEGALAERNRLLMEKYAAMRAETAFEQTDTDDAELIVVAFGSMARIARSAIRQLRAQGHKPGLFRPVTLYPFPDEALRALAPGRRFLVIEQNTGQMVEDVRLTLNGAAAVSWHGVMPGLFIGADELTEPILRALKEKKQ
ncbi:3-methyl-2-oxobutanoate dehydrogenase subunit VorB [Desulfovibrio sp. PG-178-WT-4]|uniref:3-methyl-2-oxobutanoate dehydrogenase subunit VorB n=1 Tax=Desulfovibrio porci TaxID=2605782 RepID=A0A6L5XP93_9BACT|nr:3-methyl-2-oxobutanoate dehydrogenase subunit VorB [Desulfovibrio porci]MSS29057.1 3-methyl-2-oxobutanoate dehydrogenase subunit VorB [Desulfovibrio porci]